MIVHVFNSSSVSGPERLVLPALATVPGAFLIVNLVEERIARLREVDPLEQYSHSLKLRYCRIPVKKRWDPEAVTQLQKLLKDIQPRLVHAHAVKASVYLSHANRPHAAHPLVSTHHGVHGLPDWKTRFYEWLYRKRYLPTFDRVLAVSTEDFEFLRKSGIDKDRLRLHLNGGAGRFIAAQARAEESQRIRAAWFPNEAEARQLFLFGVVGRLSAEKDHSRLFRVLAEVNRQATDRQWKCLIFGEGALEQTLRRQVARLGLEKRVVWMGYRANVGDELAGLDLLLSFSKAEGLPINVIEAGWAGTPVMATWVGGVQDLLCDDQHGLRVRPEETPAESAGPMAQLFSPEGTRRLQALGQRLQERVRQEFTQEKWMKRLQTIYAELNVWWAIGS